MAKINLSDEEKLKLIEAVNKGVEPAPDLLPKLFPGMAEKFDVKALDRAKIPTLEYAGKRSKAAILAEAGAGIGAAPLQIVRCFGEAKNGEWKNLIVQGDNLQFLKTCYKNVDPLIKDKVKGKVKLFYIDPPFATKSDFQSSEGIQSYEDKIAAAEFIEGLRERLILIREILSDDGFINVHLDQRMSHPIKVIMDEIFGRDNFRNEIVLIRSTKSVQAQFEEIGSLAVAHYNLLFYTKKSSVRFKKLEKILDSTAKGKWDTYWRSPNRPTMRYEIFGIKPESGQWRWEEARGMRAKANYEKFLKNDGDDEMLDEYYIEHFEDTGEKIDFVRLGPSKSVQYYVPPRDVKMGNTLWADIPSSARTTGYPTEKSEALLERIISWLTMPGDLVLDVFGGSGTTMAVSEKLGRRWIAADFGKHAIYTMQRRMLRIGESKALVDEQDKSGKVIVKKGEPYKKAPKKFSVVSSGGYDFSHIMDLRKHKETYIDFVLGLFQLASDEEKASKYKLANIYAVKDNNPVEVYPIWDDQFLKEVKIDETYLRGIITQSGGKLKGDYYIITPESCTNVGDTTLKNQDGKDIHFQMLTFPYKVLEDVSRNLELQEQPNSQANVNTLITSTAYYFNEDVEIAATRTSDGLKITKFETKILNKEGKRFEGISGLAMLLVDLDYEAGKPFDMDKTVFAKEIAEDGSIKIEGLTKRVGLIAIDKHGNESKPFNLE